MLVYQRVRWGYQHQAAMDQNLSTGGECRWTCHDEKMSLLVT